MKKFEYIEPGVLPIVLRFPIAVECRGCRCVKLYGTCKQEGLNYVVKCPYCKEWIEKAIEEKK